MLSTVLSLHFRCGIYSIGNVSPRTYAVIKHSSQSFSITFCTLIQKTLKITAGLGVGVLVWCVVVVVRVVVSCVWSVLVCGVVYCAAR